MPATITQTKTVQYRDFSKGMQQTSSRPALRDDESYWLENVQPIGSGQLKILPPKGNTLVSPAGGVAKFFGVTMLISGSEVTRMIVIGTDGRVSAVDPTNGAVTSILVAGSVTSNARVTVWQDTPLLIGDSSGYWSWDGTNTLKYPVSLTGNTHTNKTIDNIAPNTTGLKAGMHVLCTDLPNGTTIASVDSATQITVSAAATGTTVGIAVTVGAGAPASVVDLATFEGRAIFISGTRTRTLTAPGSYTDFQTVDGALVATLTDSNFAGKIYRCLSALEVLWQMGISAVNAMSNIQISGGVTTFSETNIVSNVGTPYPSSVTSFFRTYLFLTQYGVYAIVGSTPQKLSEQLDGLFPQLSYGSDVPAGVVTINNIFVWTVLVTYLDPATNTTRPLLLCLSRNAWFVASQGSLTWVASLVNLTTGQPELWGTDGTTIYKCFGGTGAGSWKWMTKFYDFGAFTQRKQTLRFAVETQSATSTPNITASAVNEVGVSSTIPLQSLSTSIVFVGSSAITFTGSGGVAIAWTIPSFNQRGYCNLAGDYTGFTLSGNSTPFVISGIAFEEEPCGEWT